MEGIEGRFVFKGTVSNTSPLVIGSGEGDYVDLEVLKGYGDRAYIPASSIVGVMGHRFREGRSTSDRVPQFDDIRSQEIDYFWGAGGDPDDEESGMQSHFLPDDLIPQDAPRVVVRNGVEIDRKKGIAKDRNRYDYEIVEPGATFSFTGEIPIMTGFDRGAIFQMLKWLLHELAQGEVTAGRMTTRGVGKIRLVDFELYEFSFPSHGPLWLEFRESEKNYDIIESRKVDIGPLEPAAPNADDLVIQFEFGLNGSLIVGSYSTDPDKPDKSHMMTGKDPVLPGKSIAGAVRDRAVRILNTLNTDGSVKLRNTFGWADTERKVKEKYKSRFIVEECVLDGVEPQIQQRTKIDRFTGGTVPPALFDSEPVWHKSETVRMRLRIRNCVDWEAGLLLLVLKDLWTSDLPIGGEKGVGRGTLRGVLADIRFHGEEFLIRGEDALEITDGNGAAADVKKLEAYVNALWEEASHEQIA